MFPVKPLKPSFKSYLPPLQTEVKKSPQPAVRKLEAKLLPGEIVVNEVNFVRKCIATDTSKQDLWGKLVCTNFKISFITDDAVPLLKFQYRNQLLGEHDIPLTCIEQVVTVNDGKRKQKVLGSNQKLKFNPTELIIYCKDFRIVRFCFDEAGPESAKKVCLAIAHYSQPADPQLLFGFEYVGKQYYNPAGDKVNGVDPGGGCGGGGGGVEGVQTPLFDRSSDWDREIKRTGGSEWRVCSINESYVISLSLPEYFVVPVSLADQDLKQFSVFFTGQRIPLWCWNHPNGSALVRMSSIKDMVQQRKLDQRICNAVTRSHPQRNDVYKSDLDKSLPTIQDVQAAFVRLKHICVIDPFEESDEKWLSSMESTHWLEYVRSFLKHSAELVHMLDGKHVSVVLQEEEDRDLNCVISSLVQVMLDPHFRSITGFQSLVQKEWVMAGYRFLDRCNHLKKSDKVESPLFLLFLDCVWQLLDQYPAAFEFTETYLTVLSDSLWIPVFSTFLFNCPQQRAEQSREFARSKNIHLGNEKVLQFPTVWDWSQQFTAKDQALFNNPLYVGKSATCVQNGAVKTFKRTKKNYSSTLRGMPSLRNGLLNEQEFIPRRNSLVLRLKPEFSLLKEPQESPSDQYIREWFSKPADLQGLILPQLLCSHIKVWKLCFLRWIPEAQINNGGYITAFHKVSVLADEIEMLQNRLRQYKGTPSTPGGSPETERCKMYFRASNISDTPPTPEYLTSSFPFSPVGNLCRRSSLGTPLSKFLSGAKIWISTETLANETL
ncbi:myotubularin-related protein 10 [Polyodon spathula]|uniref:myotubularin-related protein 10 n=1 Tax=Polyodon spathula TaxID=7913 RepID=UPI001B7DCD9A|nr:myotubularin-related protein 10 [Polyodon spathula]